MCVVGGVEGGEVLVCSFVQAVCEDGGMVATLWSVLCDEAISAISSGDKEGISSVTIWLVAFQLSICLCDAHSGELTHTLQ